MSRAPAIPWRATRDRISDRGGFTLIEVTLALLLIAVLAALSLPGLVRATGPSSLRIAALQVAALLREDRNMAQTTGRFVTSAVAAHQVRSGAAAAAIDLPVGTVAGVFGAPMQGIRFYGDGGSSGGSIVIASATARVVVTVSPDTGAIHVGSP